ncbi:MAG: DUF1015 family protein, partial [Pseudonocardiaceae bacterium]
MRRLRTERVDGMRQQGTGVTVRPARLLIVDPQLAGQLAELDSALLETAADSLDVVRREAARLRRMAGEGTRTREPCTVVYRLAAGGHQQTGVVVDVSIDDYRNGHIRRHEATRPERE